jgi:hypothetical protein
MRWTIFTLLLIGPGGLATASQPQTVGWIERVRIGPQGFLLQAKLDTGADSSSLGASDIDVYSRDSKFWVRFRVTNKKNETGIFDLPIVRFSRIKRHGGKSIERPVVELDICLGRINQRTRISLTDRAQFKFGVLVGRNFLSAGKLVDSSRKFVMEPSCKG